MSVATGTILVMDADAGFRESSCQALARSSYRCLGVDNARDALTAARAEPVDVALLDSGTASDGGVLPLARRLREQVPDLPVVLLTWDGSLDAALDAMRAGVFDYLFKPFRAEDLVDAVERAMQWRSAGLDQSGEISEVEQELVHRFAMLRAMVQDAAIASTSDLDPLIARLYTGNPAAVGHARRVRRHASGLASGLGISGAALDDIARAGLLHDIGKLALPERLAAKPTPLTDHEMTLFRTHPELGAEVMRTVPLLHGAAAIVAAMRERYDGSGYPAGLRRDAVPVGSAIVSLAELFDSLTGSDVSIDPVSVATANAMLVSAAGVSFDPQVVAGWLRYTET
jgi:response regulator RpfG family c-di-GMP phosphodiesterase